MQQAVLRLRDGRRQACVVPRDEGTAREILISVNTPAQASGQRLTLHTPEGAPVQVVARDIAGIEMEPPYCLIENFLPEADMERIAAHALANESKFKDSTVSLSSNQGTFTPQYGLRRSRVLDDIGNIAPIIGNRFFQVLPRVWSVLNMTPIKSRGIECQISVHGDGDFFKTHTDNGLPNIAHRVISYVYYFHREPKRFSGGYLRLYKTVIHEGTHIAGDLVADIDPPGNGLIVFPTYIQHEVTPVTCSSSSLADQRLTLNAWLAV